MQMTRSFKIEKYGKDKLSQVSVIYLAYMQNGHSLTAVYHSTYSPYILYLSCFRCHIPNLILTSVNSDKYSTQSCHSWQLHMFTVYDMQDL